MTHPFKLILKASFTITESNYDKQIAVTHCGNSRLNTDSKHLFISFSRLHMPAMRAPFISPIGGGFNTEKNWCYKYK